MSEAPKPYLVRLGRVDNTANKTLFLHSQREAMRAANSLSYVLWGRHAFKCSECTGFKREEQGDFYIEHITPDAPENRSH